MDAVLVSACLTGCRCRYDGRDKHRADLLAAIAEAGRTIVPFCPEEAGGLGTPRPAAKLHALGENTGTVDGHAVWEGRAAVVTDEGRDVTDAFRRGAELALEAAREHGCTTAYLQARSPSCGVDNVHTKEGLADGPGVTAALLGRHGIELIDVD